ncbi:hypothetical protein OF820_09615 [Oceanotoga sp. DSM 15011]|jgi:hypothetical protein|uniref:hypothetical protein n=1 Tax=Oceanotoga sp. DSM 15011 TaxID=2984951 RepID=UPI0021F49B18|nr:hypothetical protein [Oceanotoga sp. DSM 15011]UYO99322.1 hypothetical protein OF820_09615 [Oceanotoga sp. DSM 15011]
MKKALVFVFAVLMMVSMAFAASSANIEVPVKVSVARHVEINFDENDAFNFMYNPDETVNDVLEDTVAIDVKSNYGYSLLASYDAPAEDWYVNHSLAFDSSTGSWGEKVHNLTMTMEFNQAWTGYSAFAETNKGTVLVTVTADSF